jgi:glyoxylase-like metal-dependent hydrolase (beta-lactamase superfamily II)
MRIWNTPGGYKITRVISGRSNVFLLANDEKNILIDTSPKFVWNKLKKRLKQLNVDIIDYLILTHTHYDHAENSKRIKEKYRAQIFVHRNEAFYLTSGENILPKGTNVITKSIIRLFGKQFLSRFRYEPCQYDYLVDSVFDLGNIGFNAYIMHTPGHTTGSMSIIIDDNVAIVGDTMFGIFKWSVFPPFADNIIQMIDSWGKLLKTNCVVFIPAHGTANSRSLVQKEYDKRIKKTS